MLRYDPHTGLMWYHKTGKGRRFHQPIGTPNQQGQIVFRHGVRHYLVSRLAWLYVHGRWPTEIDHINGDRADNRITNLREVTHSQNLANAKTRVDNAVGTRGVCWDKQKSKWKVQIGPAGKRIQKHFERLDDAKAFAEMKHREIFGEFSNYA